MRRLIVYLAAVEERTVHSKEEDLEHAALRLHFFASPVSDTVVHCLDRAQELVEDVCGFAAARNGDLAIDASRRCVVSQRR